jgi:PBP1b-binding outer membrane lipoprotein LpoB
MKKLLLISILFLSGCSTYGNLFDKVPETKQVEILTVQEPAPIYHPPLPEVLSPAEIKWKVLNPETMRTYIQDYDKGDAPAVAYYSLTSQGYENLSNNIADIKRYIRQSLTIIEYYRDNDPTKNKENDNE